MYAKREQEILDILYTKNEPMTANQILELMKQKRHNSTIRTQLRILMHKGAITFNNNHGVFYYAPVRPREFVVRDEIDRLKNVYFGGDAKELKEAIY